MEHTSELVEIGKIIHKNSYSKKRKEINLEGIKVDIIEAKRGIIHEVKKSKSMEESHILQLKYYLYYFKQIGIEMEGIIDYPKLKKIEKVFLQDEDIKKIKESLQEVKNIIEKNTPPAPIQKPYCKKCSYYEFCYC